MIWEQIIDAVTAAKTRGQIPSKISMNAVAIAELTSWMEARGLTMVAPSVASLGAELRVMGCKVVADETQDRPVAA